MPEECEIAVATTGDIDAILDLQEQNLPSHGGTLSVRLPREWFEAAIAAMPVIVARRDGALVGYVVSSSLAANAVVPVVQAMLRAYPAAADAYVYGPVCVEETERGHGLAGAMFAMLRAHLPRREAVTFIRRDNEPSLRAHAKMGMRQLGSFDHDGVAFAALSCDG